MKQKIADNNKKRRNATTVLVCYIEQGYIIIAWLQKMALEKLYPSNRKTKSEEF